MTREEFDSLTSEDIQKLRENLKERRIIKSEIDKINVELEPLYKSFDEIDEQINSWLDLYSNEMDELKQDELLEQAEELKKQMEEIQNKIVELEAKKKEKEEELDSLENTKEKEVEPKFVSFIKESTDKIKNKLKINKKDGIKVTKKETKKENKEKVPLSMKAARFFAKIYVNHKINQARRQVKKEVFLTNASDKISSFGEWVKDDLKKGYAYKASEYIKENKEQIKANAKFKINKAKSSIARTTKKAVGGIKNQFSKIGYGLNTVKTVTVAKTERFINISKAKYEARKDRRESLNELNKSKRAALEEYRKQIEENARLVREEIKNNYDKAVANAKSL